jgi:hypothetical protein
MCEKITLRRVKNEVMSLIGSPSIGYSILEKITISISIVIGTNLSIFLVLTIIIVPGNKYYLKSTS